MALPILHITHLENLAAIVAAGGLWSNNHRPAAITAPTSIAHAQIQDRRARVLVPCGPGGTLHDYVPFYFGDRSPMLYANHMGQVPTNAVGQRSIVYLVLDAHAVANEGCGWAFTDGHAVMRPLTRYFDRLADTDRLDWTAIRARQWFDTPQDPDRKRRKQAEFLVHRFAPWRLVTEIAVYDAVTQAAVVAALGGASHHPAVAVRRPWYY